MTRRRALVATTAALLLLTAGCATRDGSDAPTSTASPAAQQISGNVQVEGNRLPEFAPVGVVDPAAGMPAPTIVSEGFDGSEATIAAGEPTILVFLAHWCPHCQAEVPILVAEWIEGDGLPEGVQVIGVPTGTDPGQPNYPPSAWLDREGWTFPTVLDDTDGTIATAFGLTSYPFFVAFDAEGTITARGAGELDPADMATLATSTLG